MPRSKLKSDKRIVDLEHYVPGYLTWVSNKLSRGASAAYLRTWGVGIEIWRLMVLLAVDGKLTANDASRVIGMDKASVSRCFKLMADQGIVEMQLDKSDGRLRVAQFTTKGRSIHDEIIGLALERERAFLSVLSESESRQFLGYLVRLHENLPMVESATDIYLTKFHSKLSSQRGRN